MRIQRQIALIGVTSAATIVLGSWSAYAMATAESKPEPAAPATAPDGIRAVYNPKLGIIAADATGRTIYRFDKDTKTSSCTGECEKKWPVVKYQESLKFDGVDRKDIGSIKRKDGSKQLTLGGWPAYYFFKDTQPGQTNGQGVDGVWHVSAPSGAKARHPEGGGPETEMKKSILAKDSSR